jgi:hypothetical protein
MHWLESVENEGIRIERGGKIFATFDCPVASNVRE